jgi:YggT family protein
MADIILLLHVIIVWLRVGFTAVLVVATVLAALAWAERTRRINAFGGLARFARKLDPLIAPVERRVGRFGGTHANAPWWALLAVLLIGAALLGLVGYLRDVLASIYYAMDQGPRGVARLAVSSLFMVIQLALIARVIMSWVGGTYSRIGQLAYKLTEWFLGPLRGVLPSIGMVDISPMVAYFALSLIRGFVLGAI